jgi:ketosteroid isomerase-like protein
VQQAPAASVETQKPAPKPAPATPSGPAPVASVAIVGAPGQLTPGESVTLTADLRDAANRALGGRTVRWTSSALGVVRVDASGRVTALSPGSAVISAESEGRRGTATITVSPIPVARIDLQPAGGSIEAGKTLRLAATPLAGDGSTLDRPVTWSSSNASVAAVAADGLVTGRAAGTAVITASAGGQTGSTNVTVTPHVPTAAELKALVDTTIQNYGKALENKDIDAVRHIYVGMSSDAESKLRDAVSGMRDIAITLTISGVRISGSSATASVKQDWTFTDSDGHRRTLPAQNVYTLRRDGAGWVIIDIK